MFCFEILRIFGEKKSQMSKDGNRAATPRCREPMSRRRATPQHGMPRPRFPKGHPLGMPQRRPTPRRSCCSQ